MKLTSLSKNDSVLEIGAGKGHITRALCAHCASVYATEIDSMLYRTLKENLGSAVNLRLSNTDFLKSKLPQTSYKVFSNIPFSITTEIIRKLTQAPNPPQEAWLVMEKGAAKRFSGLPHDTLHSLLLKPFFETEIVWHFRREDFRPTPRVDCVLLRLAKREAPDLDLDERDAYRTFLTESIRHGMWGKSAPLTKKQVSTALRLAALPQVKPSREILYIQWLCLFRCWQRFGGNHYK